MNDYLDLIDYIGHSFPEACCKHTFVVFTNGAAAYSCDFYQNNWDSIPSLRPENCVVCNSTENVFLVDELDSYLCTKCEADFDAWIGINPELPPMDFLREKLTHHE